jgi:hypothetical protein
MFHSHLHECLSIVQMHLHVVASNKSSAFFDPDVVVVVRRKFWLLTQRRQSFCIFSKCIVPILDG